LFPGELCGLQLQLLSSGTLSKVPECNIIRAIREQYRTNFWDPELAEVIEFSLSERVCDSFLWTSPDVPMLPRDSVLAAKARSAEIAYQI
jgi:hypothetical protein